MIINNMKAFILSATVLISSVSFAGNPDRAGASGASQLLLNPWAKSSGLGGANSASVIGAQAIFSNVAGLSMIKKTDVQLSFTNYLKGSDTRVNAVGFGQRVGESGVIGFNIVTMSFGTEDRTTENMPDGGAGTFSPRFANIALSYAKEFSNSISGGITLRVFSESIANVSGTGVAFDAGVRYVTGDKGSTRIGISVKNLGPPYDYSGDGIAKEINNPTDPNEKFTINSRIDNFELPAQLNIGFGQDVYLDAEDDHKLTGHFNFLSNSFQLDQYQLAADYTFKERFNIGCGYFIENKSSVSAYETNVLTGFSVGFGAYFPLTESGSRLGVNYAYRPTRTFSGNHSFGISLNLQ
jgi:hypothetical protein